ncbi:MAG: TonB-dependent receptor [Phenylobacterium sp.]|uniref:TonB-dependent receptor plug domain-containing protein n=1 Tax=Phenylobacterium sp. TaxID=1871053 RepID=UPI0012120D97|nr:TonB-dependent receptor [Phenylobacterium sp.]TAJ70836.1 MAG: TonB-dependent receptor [Phenylobacterium sp.]
MSRKSNLLLWASPAAAIAVMASPASAQDVVANFNIASQPMQGALNALSAQSGVRLLYPYDRVSGLTSPAVKGRMPTRTALGHIIAGAPLRVAMAQKDLIALSASTPQAGLIRTASVGPIYATAAAATVQDEGAGAPARPPAVQDVETVVVTGIRGAPRTIIDSPTPIDSFTAADLEKSGRAGVFQALQTLAPSFNLPFRAGGGTSTIIATGGLRGLNPDQTLVLVNGKRRHKTSLINAVSSLYNGSVPADLDMIPTAAIERIEVLRDGAAAQYGSDAIAGVINIILKGDTNAGSLSATYGLNFDRKDGDLTQYAFNKGFTFGEAGFINVSLNYKDQRLSNRAYPIDPSIQLFPLVGGARDPREATIDRLVTKNFGQLPQTNTTFGFSGGYDFGKIALYGFGTYSKRESDLPFTYRTPNNVNTTPALYPLGYRPNEVVNEDDFEFTGGMKGDLGGWDWDLSTGYGKNKAKLHTSNTENASLGPASPKTFYIGTLQSDEVTSNLDVTRGFDLGSSQLQVSFGAQYRREGYKILAGEPASYAEGLYRAPAGQPFAGVAPQTGAQATPGFRPADASTSHRDSKAVYGELGWDATERLFIGAAARYEDYSDSSGDTLTGKLTGRYEVNDWFSLRGAISNGFRAPGLAQQHYAATSSQFRTVNGVPNQLLLIKTLPVSAPEAIALGARPLTPEKSKNISGGFTLQPLSGLDITVDGYQIEVDNRIAITSTLTGTAVSNILISKGLSGDLSAQYYTNAIDTRTRGIDVVGTYRYDLGDWGRLRANAGFNYGKTKIRNIIPNPPELTALGANFVLFGRGSQGYLTTSFPRSKVALGLNWDWNKLNVNLRSTRYGKYTVIADLPAQDRSFGAKWITDLEVSYKVLETVTVAAGANNLFNEYPDKNGIYNAATGSGHFPGTSPFGFTGGSWYARVQYTF